MKLKLNQYLKLSSQNHPFNPKIQWIQNHEFQMLSKLNHMWCNESTQNVEDN